jgi:hypothetical protein
MNAVDVVVHDLVEVEFHIWPAAAHCYAVVTSRDQETGTGVEIADHPNRAGASCPHRLPAREKAAIVRRAIVLTNCPNGATFKLVAAAALLVPLPKIRVIDAQLEALRALSDNRGEIAPANAQIGS